MIKKLEEKKEEVEKTNIKSIKLVDEMKSSYLDYAMSVITSRALPDVRDGLKPVNRRIIFAMNEIGLTHLAKTKKSANVIGEVLGKYHPHGDTAVYDAMVKMVQPFYARYPLVKGQGNFGSIDGDSAAAHRYTEAKMSAISEKLVNDIDKDTVEWVPNYENTRKEPVVFPSILPNLLTNGTFGIAVGMATSIPPHNLREICDGILHLLNNKDATTSDVLKFIKGPDFPLGGLVYDKKAIKEAYQTSRGGVVVRGHAEITESKNGMKQIIITSLPYNVIKSDLLSKIGMLVRDKKLKGIKDLRDESTNDIRIVIDLKQEAEAKRIVNYLYKNTNLSNTFNFNMIALLKGVPRSFSLIEILSEYIEHRRIIVERRTKFDLKKAKEREHILSGFYDAFDEIDAIITTIRNSKDVKVAHANLVKKFKFSDIQASAILEMRLQKLAGLEREKIKNDLKDIKIAITKLEAILNTSKSIDKEIEKEVIKLKEKYGDDRRTTIISHSVDNISDEDLIQDEDTVLVLTQNGYVKRTNPREFKVQKRGGVGVVDLNTKDEDTIHSLLVASMKDTIYFFTDKGKIYKCKMHELPEGKRTNRGSALVNFISLMGNEYVRSIVPLNENTETSELCFVTINGLIKKTKIKEFSSIRKTGIVAIDLDPKDALCKCFLVNDNMDIMLITKKGKSIRFAAKTLRATGRSSKGVKGMNIAKDDSVITAMPILSTSKDTKIFTITSKGYGKMTLVDAYKVQKRGGFGIKTMNISESTGNIVGANAIIPTKELEVIAISQQSQVIRINVSDIPTSGRQTKGVSLMKVRKGDRVAAVTYI